jgi:hypothetical protein
MFVLDAVVPDICMWHAPKFHNCSRCSVNGVCMSRQVKEQMADPAFQDNIRQASMAACAQLPEGVMQDTCDMFVEQYGETHWRMYSSCTAAVRRSWLPVLLPPSATLQL